MPAFDTAKHYRKIFILESRRWWPSCSMQFSPAVDVVLTYDFGLCREIESQGGQAFYIDHLLDREVMHENNFLVYKFFRDWHHDASGKDIFEYKGVPFGMAFRIEIWNDLLFYVRTRLCLATLNNVVFDQLLIGTRTGLVERILKEMKTPFVTVSPDNTAMSPEYYFPIHAWMDEKVRYVGAGGLKYRLRGFITSVIGTTMSWMDFLWPMRRKPAVFVQEYYPTRGVVKALQKDSRLSLVLATLSRNLGWFRYVPIWGRATQMRQESEELMQKFRASRCATAAFPGQANLTEEAYRIIDERISGRIANTLHVLDCVVNYLDRYPIKLAVLIANMGQVATQLDCVCRAKGIPTFMIINGYMSGGFLDDGKYATIINSYSTSIKENYFKGMENVVVLGDPRMDDYPPTEMSRSINRVTPTVTIGASGHSIVDLNSFLAVEFDFMFDVLFALRPFKQQNPSMRIVIKVRANGYARQYQQFVDEYFPGVVDEILQTVPMRLVLDKTDFYISLYSQTLFEASCLGIPCVYYKNDSEFLDPPYDENSELVTVGNPESLADAFVDFLADSPRFKAFMDRDVMEKYIGPLDGKNLERNVTHIYSMLGLEALKTA